MQFHLCFLNKVSFLIDGFNLYHSIIQLEEDTGLSLKWLDLRSLFNSYIYLFGRDAEISSVYYFSAMSYFKQNTDKDTIYRQQTYHKALKNSSVKIILGRFKKKYVFCPNCKSTFIRREEKETDVAIASKLFELCINDSASSIILVTGDTDLISAYKTTQKLFPHKKMLFIFPYKRKNKELLKTAPDSFSINKKQYLKYQFPEIIHTASEVIPRPETW